MLSEQQTRKPSVSVISVWLLTQAAGFTGSAQGTDLFVLTCQHPKSLLLHQRETPCASCGELNPSSWTESCEHPTCGWWRRKRCKGYLCLEGNTRPRNSHFWSCRSGTAEHVYYDCRSEAPKRGVQETEFSLGDGRRINQKNIFLFSILYFFSLHNQFK